MRAWIRIIPSRFSKGIVTVPSGSLGAAADTAGFAAAKATTTSGIAATNSTATSTPDRDRTVFNDRARVRLSPSPRAQQVDSVLHRLGAVLEHRAASGEMDALLHDHAHGSDIALDAGAGLHLE